MSDDQEIVPGVKSKTVVVDFSNFEMLEDVAAAIDEKIATVVAGLPVGSKVITVEINPATTHYSRSDPDNMMRDFHYNDSGVLITLVYVVIKKIPTGLGY